MVRRAINVIKDRVAAMDWQVRVRRGGCAQGERQQMDAKAEGTAAHAAKSRMRSDSFRTLIEQVIEDALTGGYGAIEMEPTGRSGAAGDAVGGGWGVDPHQCASGTATRRRRATRR